MKQKTRRDEQNDDDDEEEEEDVERLDDGARLVLRAEKAHAGVILVDDVMVAAVAASDSAVSEPRQTVCRR